MTHAMHYRYPRRTKCKVQGRSKKIERNTQRNAAMCVGYMSKKCVSTKLVSKRENREVKVRRNIQLAVV
jgi:hypothetical protein